MTKIRLPRDGAEYAHFFFNDAPDTDAVLEAQVSGGSWQALDTGGPVPRLLLRGPDAPGATGYLVAQDGEIRVRIRDNPEIIVRGAGYVALTS